MAGGFVPTTGLLPEPGGTLDQGAWLIAAFDILSDAAARLAPPE